MRKTRTQMFSLGWWNFIVNNCKLNVSRYKVDNGLIVFWTVSGQG